MQSYHTRLRLLVIHVIVQISRTSDTNPQADPVLSLPSLLYHQSSRSASLMYEPGMSTTLALR